METQIQEISFQDIEMKIRESKLFRIRYFAKKHNDYIIRHGVVCDKMKFWESKKGDLCFTYYDIDAHGYRTARDIDWIQGAKVASKELH